ncbi:MAG: type II toxin-antitoxin system HicA family toxin [Rhodoferax sp.]|nr:type II toxin-antitoxin system HicA family toxin [Rhodoferax sp.]
MKSISGKTFAKLLESRGWKLVRVNGSHHVYVNHPGLKAGAWSQKTFEPG